MPFKALLLTIDTSLYKAILDDRCPGLHQLAAKSLLVRSDLQTAFSRLAHNRLTKAYSNVKPIAYIMASSSKTIIVEHLDPELGPWSELEYRCIAKESHERSSDFILSCLPDGFKVPEALANSPAFKAEHRGVEELYADSRNRVCLLDPSAAKDLSPEDGDDFDVFLFGGILGDDPPRDRTSELRKKGFEGRRLGPKQMTTDTAVRVTRIVVQDKVALDKIDYLDFPELKFNKYESTQMPFRYVKGANGEPIMPEGMKELIQKDADKAVNDLI